jgi:hypothetical protein
MLKKPTNTLNIPIQSFIKEPNLKIYLINMLGFLLNK